MGTTDTKKLLLIRNNSNLIYSELLSNNSNQEQNYHELCSTVQRSESNWWNVGKNEAKKRKKLNHGDSQV